MSGKVLIFRLQILGCDGDGEISTVMGMGKIWWGWSGDGDNFICPITLYISDRQSERITMFSVISVVSIFKTLCYNLRQWNKSSSWGQSSVTVVSVSPRCDSDGGLPRWWHDLPWVWSHCWWQVIAYHKPVCGIIYCNVNKLNGCNFTSCYVYY